MNMLALVLNAAIGLVWLGMGLGLKVLPYFAGGGRHAAIVQRILGGSYAQELTLLIGLGEVVLGLWVLAGRWPKATAGLQIGLVLTMNALELSLTHDLLLWGYWNGLWALAYCVLVYVRGFILPAKPAP